MSRILVAKPGRPPCHRGAFSRKTKGAWREDPQMGVWEKRKPSTSSLDAVETDLWVADILSSSPLSLGDCFTAVSWAAGRAFPETLENCGF